MSLPTSFSTLPVEDVMHKGVIDCPPQAPLREVASLMAEHSVHYVIVDGLARGPHETERFLWGAVSDVDLMRIAGAGGLDREAADIAASEIVTIHPDEDIEHAAQVMGEHDCSHLIVVARDSERPMGVISTLDIVRGLVWGRRT